MGIREVAKMASVSTATVSRLITGSARVSPETATRVLHAMEALEFEPNEAARILAILKKLKRNGGGQFGRSTLGAYSRACECPVLSRRADNSSDCPKVESDVRTDRRSGAEQQARGDRCDIRSH
jgi:hypothetical protein